MLYSRPLIFLAVVILALVPAPWPPNRPQVASPEVGEHEVGAGALSTGSDTEDRECRGIMAEGQKDRFY